MFKKIEHSQINSKIIQIFQKISLEENTNTIITKSLKLIKNISNSKLVIISLLDKQEKKIQTYILKKEKENKIENSLKKVNKIYKLIQNQKNKINYNPSNKYISHQEKTQTTDNLINISLESKKEKLGIIQISNSKIKESDTEEKEFLLFIREQIPLILEKNKALKELKQSNNQIEKKIEKLKYLYSITMPKETKINIKPTLKSIFKKITKVLNASKASLILYETNKKYLYFLDSIGHNKNYIKTTKLNPNEGVIGYVLNKKKPLFINKISQSQFQNLGLSNILLYKSNLSFISIPLISKTDIIGIINITEKKSPNKQDAKFTYQDFHIVLNISKHIIKIYENNKIIKNLINQKSINKEIKIMKLLHNSLLPKKIPTVKNLIINIYKNQDDSLTGDFYDFVKLDKEKLAFIICKINYQGIPGALLTAFFKNSLKISIKENISPKYILSTLQQQTIKDKRPNQSEELICGIIDTHNEIITYSSKLKSNLNIMFYNEKTKKIHSIIKKKKINSKKEIQEYITPIKKENKLILWSSKIEKNINKKQTENKISEIISQLPNKNTQLLENNNKKFKNIRTMIIFSLENKSNIKTLKNLVIKQSKT